MDLEQTRKEILNELDPNFSPGRVAPNTESDPKGNTAKDAEGETPQFPDFKLLKPDPVDTSKRYDVYCIEHGEAVVYRNVLFKGVKGLFPDRKIDMSSHYI